MKRLFFAVLLVAPLVVWAGPTFEYKVVVLDRLTPPQKVEQALNRLGAQGWELVGTERVIYSGISTGIAYYLKLEEPLDR